MNFSLSSFQDGKTALFSASTLGYAQIVELLLRSGAYVNHQTKVSLLMSIQLSNVKLKVNYTYLFKCIPF